MFTQILISSLLFHDHAYNLSGLATFCLILNFTFQLKAIVMSRVRFGQNPLFGSRDNVQKYYFGQNKLTFQSADETLKIRIYASLVKLHPLVQKIECGNEARQTGMGSAPKPICSHL